MADSVCRNLRDGVVEGEFAPSIMVQDSLHTSGGTPTFLYFLRSLASNISAGRAQAKGLVLVTTDRRPESYRALLEQEKQQPLWFQVVDCFTDPLGWEMMIKEYQKVEEVKQGVLSSNIFREIGDLKSLMSTILRSAQVALGSDSKAHFSVAIDSISTLLQHNSVQSIARFLSILRSHGELSSIIWLMHSDLHEARTVSSLEYISSTIMFVERLGKSKSWQVDFKSTYDFQNETSNRGILRIRQKRRNGRVRDQVEEFKTEGFDVKFFSTAQKTEVEIGKSSVPQVQFNLQLTDKEREDRAKVVLPFEHQGDGREVHIYNGRVDTGSTLQDIGALKTDLTKLEIVSTSKSSGFGEVHYLRDSDDERPDSDEDPDDDLDI